MGSYEKKKQYRHLEDDLENAGHSQLAQIICFNMFVVNVPKHRQRKHSEWCQRVVEADIEVGCRTREKRPGGSRGFEEITDTVCSRQ